MPVPVIVVGNLTAGGTGKTPLVIWLAELLKAAGKSPGILSRGYRSSAGRGPVVVLESMLASECGDEPLMICRRTACPVVVGSDRVGAASRLVALGCDVLISDDGMQHARLARDLELLVIDGARGTGNGAMLPAGPLREPVSRLATVDALICHGECNDGDALAMTLAGDRFVSLDQKRVVDAGWFRTRVHAVAGIAHPQRFFETLARLGLAIIPHAFPDHHGFLPGELVFDDDFPIIMTEKDAVRLGDSGMARVWFLPVSAQFDAGSGLRLSELVEGVLGKKAA